MVASTSHTQKTVETVGFQQDKSSSFIHTPKRSYNMVQSGVHLTVTMATFDARLPFVLPIAQKLLHGIRCLFIRTSVLFQVANQS